MSEGSIESVLLVQALWETRGGAERMMNGIRQLLEANGHTVQPFGVRQAHDPELPNNDLFPPYREMGSARFTPQALMAAGGLVYSPRARRALGALVDREMPDIAHVGTIAHHLSPSVLLELAARDIPVLLHLHDFKLVCPNYKMLVDGAVCDRCLGGSAVHAVTHRCMKGSYTASALVAVESYVHRVMRVYERTVDLILAPSQNLADTMIAGGIPADRIRVLHNFVDGSLWPSADSAECAEKPYVLAAGRLSFEKGLESLIKAMSMVRDVELRIAGNGAEREALGRLVADIGLTNVRFEGHRSHDELWRLMAGSRAVVVPSECHEVCSNTVLEAQCVGRPVIATRMGGTPEIMRDGVTGLLVDAKDTHAIARAIRTVVDDPARSATMGQAGRDLVGRWYSPEAYHPRLMRLYDETRELHAKGERWVWRRDSRVARA